MKNPLDITVFISGVPWDKMFPDILWVLFWAILLFLTKDFLRTLITAIVNRLKHGAGIKIGSFELQELKVNAAGPIENSHFNITGDHDQIREKERATFYTRQRGAMLVHKIFKSQKSEQLYDVLIYLVPKKGCNIIQVTGVEYYFGKHWNEKIFKSSDRSNGFAIATAAYGPFLCTAKIIFNDGKSETVYRFIDFEMGDVAALLKKEDENSHPLL